MTRIDYKLSIEDKDVLLFNKFLGYWDPINSNIWFLWNEEKFEKGQSILDKINLINDNSKINIFYDEINWYFTKQFTDYQDYESMWYWYKIMQKKIIKDLNKAFISEFFFLPSFSWYKLWETYLKDNDIKDIKNRNDFYDSNSNLSNLLLSRLDYIFWLLNNNNFINKKEIYIYWRDNNIDDKIDFLFKTKYKDYIDELKVPLKYDKEWNNIKIKKFILNWNIIYITKDIIII